MIARVHGIALAGLLGVASAAGAYATITTAQLGDSETKPELVASATIAKRSARLDAWEASLTRALATKPPKLPAVPRYERVSLVGAPAAAPLPATAVRRSAPASTPPARAHAAPRAQAASAAPLADEAQTRVSRTHTAPASARTDAEAAKPVEQEPAETTSPAPAPAPAPTAPLSQPVPAERSEHDIEQQCEALKRAAEGQGDQAKREAERQCEALKQAGEKED